MSRFNSQHYADKRLQFTAEGQTVTFHCYCRDNRSGFVHEAAMYETENYYPTAENKCQYYNRTWEEWGYQTVISGIVYELMQAERARLQASWMDQRGYERMSAKRRAEYEADKNAGRSDRLTFLETLYFCIHTAKSSTLRYEKAGNRERDILDNLENVSMIHKSPDHEVFRFWHSNGENFCDYDAKQKRFVG